MEDIEGLFKTAMGEIERMLNTKTVVGEPINIEGNTLIPLVSVGFGFGAGGGTGKMKVGGAGEGTGGGTGGGGGVKPVALLIINKEGVRLEPIKGAATSVLEKVAETIGKTAHRERKEH
ncbi:MAG: sporulation protein YtfJ [Gammaproteobacteria bacterium]|nr:sporulation protein YtfJ [Gammaproteobacteria bacterium]NIR99038.1 sporulation protein YtfJ [Gammaproteobacteria bacterium]NIT64661.1 sporulation protein YtfJ [Gammaproteobacteria bacterium]NIY33241.1 sporulation protein YtfJ [Gammaproteobacteria bacterium]